MDGIISINKEMGYTSNDVIAILRGILRMKKIGHTGTLDPDATGVLFPALLILMFLVEGIRVLKKEGKSFSNALSLLFALRWVHRPG